MESNSNRIKFLLTRYLHKQCTALEAEELFSYIEKNPNDPDLHNIIDGDAIDTLASREMLSKDISATLKLGLQDKLKLKGLSTTIPAGRQIFFTSYGKVAAVFVVALVCFAAFKFGLDKSGEVIIKTSFGEVRTIVLPDKSTVKLNGNSTLRYAKDWDAARDREVSLNGEGYFDIVHQSDHKKFLVHASNGVTIEVLGTQFNVNDRRNRTQVVLHSGEIKLDIAREEQPYEILMHSGDYVEVAGKAEVTRKVVDTQPYASWQKSKLVFNETPLQDILTMLEDNYGYKANVRDSSLLAETFTASYPADDINVLLQALSKSFKITVNQTDKEIVIGK